MFQHQVTVCMFQTPNSCFNGVEYFDATNDDNNSLLCTETIDNLDLDDVIKYISLQVKRCILVYVKSNAWISLHIHAV